MKVNLVHSTGGFGFGDCEPPDHPDYNTTCTCEHCGRDFKPLSGEPEIYCSFEHWHLHCLGVVKDQIESWIRLKYPLFKTLTLLKACYSGDMTGCTYNRFKRIIEYRYKQNAEI